MFTGSVSFEARIKGNGLTFPTVVFDPKEAGVDRVEMEGSSGNEIGSTVHLSSAASPDDGRTLAARAVYPCVAHSCASWNQPMMSWVVTFSSASPRAS